MALDKRAPPAHNTPTTNIAALPTATKIPKGPKNEQVRKLIVKPAPTCSAHRSLFFHYVINQFLYNNINKVLFQARRWL